MGNRMMLVDRSIPDRKSEEIHGRFIHLYMAKQSIKYRPFVHREQGIHSTNYCSGESFLFELLIFISYMPITLPSL